MTPKSTRLKRVQNYKNIGQKLNKIQFNKYATKSGFKKRKGKKITGKALLIAFIYLAMHGRNSFQHWAEQLGLIAGKTISKQAIWKRITSRFTIFLRMVLFDALEQQISNINKQSRSYSWQKKYKRILLQDSTTIALPSWLNWCYPGNVSGGEKKSQLKIQVVYDLLANSFIFFEITPYTANDQSKSKDILSIAKPGDLVIRDLGYFVLDSFDEMYQKGIVFLSRLRYGVSVYDMETGKEINLFKLIKKGGGLDAWVRVGKEQKLQVRLVAIKLPQEEYANRIRKAKNDRDKRLNHSKDYYKMLEYNIFITTEDQRTFSTAQIGRLYQLRWRIETIFKCWKSNFHLQKLIPYNCPLTKERVDAIIYMMLIFILLFQVTIFNTALLAAGKMKNYYLSLFKPCKYIAENIYLFWNNDLNDLMPQILYYCKHEKRCDRKSFIQKLKLS